MDNELWATIRRMREVEHLSISEISRLLRIHRKTVRRALEYVSAPPGNESRERGVAGKLEPFKPYITERLKEYPNLTGAKLLLEIGKQGYSGGYTILKDYLQDNRPGRKPDVFLRIETQPGEYAQVDWANTGHLTIGNARRQLSCFVMVLSYSRMMYIEFTLSQRIEDFIAAHVNAFQFFGGIPRKINYDNLKTVVLSRVGQDIRFNSKFMDFAGYYLFKPVPCGVRKANEKGKVENGIKYLRSSFLDGQTISSREQIQSEALRWLEEIANTRKHGSTNERPIDRFEKERALLMSLPLNQYDCSIAASARATNQSLVWFDGNRYSVPCGFTHKTLTIKATSMQVAVYAGTRILTSHARCYEKNRVIENPKHYEGLLAQRKKARMSKLVESFLNLAPECSVYLKGLVSAELNLQSQLEKIQDMLNKYGKADVKIAISRALKYQAFGAHYIQNIIVQQRAARNIAEPQSITLAKKPQWNDLAVEESDLALYDNLFEEEPTDGGTTKPK